MLRNAVLAVVFAVVAHAQTSAPQAPPANIGITRPEPIESAAAAKPELTELERALIENLNLLTELRRAQLEADTCRGALAQPRADASAQQISRTLATVRQRIEQDHPGFVWDAATGTFAVKPAEKQ